VIYSFDEFALDTRRCELRRGDEPLHLEPQVYAVLCHLLENRDRLVRKEELLDAVWGHRFVSPATLNSRIRSLRQALRDDGTAQRIVQTVRGVGFRFVSAVEIAEPAPQPPESQPVPGIPGADSAPTPLQEPIDEPSVVELSTRPVGSPAEEVSARDTRELEQQIRFCRTPDAGRIAYALSGSGPPLLKPANWLTHLEFDWASPVWRHWLRELSRDHLLIRYDERGCGLSDRDVEDVSLEAWVRDLEHVMDELQLERVPMLAMSQGCAVAITYAVRHPERVSRLVLYGGYPQGRFRRPDQAQRELSSALLKMLPLVWGCDNAAFRQFFGHVFLPEGTPEQIAWFSDLQRVSATADMAVRIWLACAAIDVVDVAPRVHVPTLVLHATGDSVVPFEQGRLLAALIPGARLVPLQSKNHVLLESEAAWGHFLEEVREFLSEKEGGVPLLPSKPDRVAQERVIRLVR